MNNKLGILGQILALFIIVSIIMSTLLFININYLSNMLEDQHQQAINMIKQERILEEQMITARRTEKLELILGI